MPLLPTFRSRPATRALGAAGLTVALAASALAAPQSGAFASGETARASQTAQAGQPTYRRINGNPDEQAGLDVSSTLCGAPTEAGNPEDFNFGYGNGQPRPYGPLSVAFKPTRDEYSIALRARTTEPSRVDLFDVQVFHPARSVEGFVYVTYTPDTAVDEQYVGTFDFIDSTRGWHPVYASGTTLEWSRLVRGEFDPLEVEPSTLAELASEIGTPSDVAQAGFSFGCDNKVVYVDGLRLGSSRDGWNVYDMVGRPSSISLRVAGPTDTCTLSSRSYPVTAKVRGRIEGLEDWAIWRLDRKGRLVRRLTEVKTSRDSRFEGSFEVRRSAPVVAFAPNSNTTEAAISKPVRVAAVPQVDFGGRDRVAVQGGGLGFSGRIKAGGRVAYTVLYTHWTGRSWTPFRAVGKGRTSRSGAFSVSAPTGVTGFSRVSILTKANKKVNASLSRNTATYRVVPRSSGGGGTTPDDFNDSSQPESSTPPVIPAPVPVPVIPDSGGDNEPAPIPEPGRPIVVEKAKNGFGACGWKPPASRPTS